MPWPSFPSFVRDAQKRDAVPVLVPLDAAGRLDVAAVRAAVTPRTRLLFVATPNNPTGRAVPAEELIALVRDLPEHVLPVIDEAYFDYLDPADRFDAIADLVRAGDDVLALRTFSKLYGLAGLRVGYGVGPAAVVAAIRKVQRGYDVGTLAQVAALASLEDTAEVERRRAANRIAVADLTELLRARGLEPHPDSATNFVLVEVGADADAITASLLAAGVSVQSGTPFGAPTSLRIGAGSAADLELLDAGSRPRARRVQRGLTTVNPGGSGRGLRYPEPRAHGASFRMRTTLKRGVGRGHSGNGNGKMQLPPGPTAPVTIYRQPEPPRRSRSRLALSILGWAFTVVRGLRRRCRRRRLSLHPRDGGRRGGPQHRREGNREEARHPDRGPARDCARDRLRPAGERGEGRAVAFGHADVDPRRSGRKDHLAALVPA